MAAPCASLARTRTPEARRFPLGRLAARWLWSGSVALVLAGCAVAAPALPPPTVTSAQVPTRPPAPAATATPDHAQMLARLQRTASLDEAAGQCAALIGKAADAAYARVETPKEQDCVPCNKLPIGFSDRGIPVREVKLPLEGRSWVWLTVDDLLCVYLYEQGEFKPSSVTHW